MSAMTRVARSKGGTIPPNSEDAAEHAGTIQVPTYFARKIIWMRTLGGILLIFFAPLIGLLVLLVRVTSPGPGLYRQTRLGKDGQRFELFKIRTMYCDAEGLSGPMLCQPKDSRITPIGRLLRFLHLDELPQLVNVLRGEMCLVGPRPERPEIIAKNRLYESVPGFIERTRVRPGVTGLAQINLPADQTADCVVPKVQLDLEYIRTANAGLDIRVLMCTALRMAGVRHGRAVRLFGVGRSVEVAASEFKLNGSSAVHAYALNSLKIKTLDPLRVPLAAATVGNGSSAIGSSMPASDWDDAPHTIHHSHEPSEVPHRPR